ncbi:hypothetical protein L9F63_027910, partial [Diploptera punctata]
HRASRRFKPTSTLTTTVSLLAVFNLMRNSISPAEREKYRPRSSPEPEHKKLKKEEKDCH